MSTQTLPSVPQSLIASPDGLAQLCAHLRAAGRFAFDTEFIGENSYHPVLCLVQVATEDRVELIDPFALHGDALNPLWDLMADPAVEKVFHAGEQDLAIVFHKRHVKTAHAFDTQIGAAMIGLGYPLAYWRLVDLFCGVELDKAHTYSAWDRRPLSQQQFAYAVDDVRYLPTIHQGMVERIRALDHERWARQACDELATHAAHRVDPRSLFVRFKGANQFNGAQLAVLRELAALREQWAFEHDLPPRTMLRDEAVMDIVQRMPKREADLLAIRSVPKEEVTSYGNEILAAVERGRACSPEDYPSIPIPNEDSLEVKRLADTLWAAANVICLGQSVTPGLVTSQAEITSLARRVVSGKNFDQHPLMSGWHRECVGEPLAKMLRGELQLDVVLKENTLQARFVNIP